VISTRQAARQTFWRNPVMVKEVRTRMRGWRAFAVVSAHLIILGTALVLAFLVFSPSLGGTPNLNDRRMFGKALFGLMIWMELITICFTAPALTSGAIASERERQTFDLLRVTLLTPGRLILGKYLSGLVFIFLLLFSALPLQSLAFILGGVTVEEIMIAILILVVTAIAFCAVGLFFSSLFSRVLFSTVLSYAFAIFMVFGIPMIALFLLFIFSASLDRGIDQLGTGGQILLVYIGWIVTSITPGATIIATEAALLDHQGIFLATLELGSGVRVSMPSPWLAYVVFFLVVSLVLLWFSYLRVQHSE
jgi:ABC-2 type transport system permease protein